MTPGDQTGRRVAERFLSASKAETKWVKSVSVVVSVVVVVELRVVVWRGSGGPHTDLLLPPAALR